MTTGNQSQAATKLQLVTHTMVGAGAAAMGTGLQPMVSVKGATRSERCISSERLWNWIDAHGKEYGIG
jgi:hypothetical protein